MVDSGLDDSYLFYLTNSYHVQASVFESVTNVNVSCLRKKHESSTITC